MLPGGAPEYMVGERTALYPLGFGLSYTQFEYRDLEVDVVDEASCRVGVRVKVCHVGSRVGTETVQRRSSRVISASLSALLPVICLWKRPLSFSLKNKF